MMKLFLKNLINIIYTYFVTIAVHFEYKSSIHLIYNPFFKSQMKIHVFSFMLCYTFNNNFNILDI